MKITPLVASIALLLASVSAHAQGGVSYSWSGADNGTWNTPGNWNRKAGFPNAAADSATFNAAGAAGSLQRVSVNGSFSIGTINLNDTNTTGAGFNLRTGTLTFASGGLISNSTKHSIIGSNLALNSLVFVNLGSATSVLDLTGKLTGTGPINAYNGGSLTLTGDNTFTGGVSFFAKTLTINSNAALGANSSLLTMGGGSTLVLAGDVDGGRTVVINGRQTTRGRRGNSSSSTPVTIDTHGNNGTFRLINGGTQAQRASAAAVQTPTANAIKTGEGTLTLVGDSSLDSFVANKGAVILDGTLATTNGTSITDGALFGGTGTVTGNFSNAGIVSPGNSPGTITITGNYTQTAAGTLRIEIAGNAAGQFDLLAVGGKATIAGTAQFITLNNFAPAGGDRFTFLTAGGGVTGTFNPVTLDAPLLGGTVEYAAKSATLVIVRKPIIAPPPPPPPTVVAAPAPIPALTTNQTSLAHVLDDNINDRRLRRVFAPIDLLPAIAIPGALDLLAPEELSALYEIGIGFANAQGFNLDRHLSEVRAGRTGFSADHLALADRGGKNTIQPDGKTGGGKDVFAPTTDNPWSTFIAGTGQWLNLDSDGNSEGYEIRTGGITLGLDYRLAPNVAVGLLTGYANSTAELANDGSIRVNSGKLGLYASWFDNGCYLNGLLTGGYNDYEIKRNGLGGKAHGDTTGLEWGALISAGHDFQAGSVTVGPIVEAQFNHVAYDGFRERGSVAPLNIQGNDSDSLRTRVGARAAVKFHIGQIQIRPEVRVSWEHEYFDQTRPTDARFASGVGSIFRVEGPEHGRDSLLVNGTITLLTGERVSVFVGYDGTLARDGYASHTVSGGLQWSF